MSKNSWSFVVVTASLVVASIGASQADAQSRLLGRMRGRSAGNQCCPTQRCQTQTQTCQTTTCATPCAANRVAAATYTNAQPISSCGGCGNSVVATGAIEPIPMSGTVVGTASYMSDGGYAAPTSAVGCQGCGGVQHATFVQPAAYGHVEPVAYGQNMPGEYFGGDSGCAGCQSVQGAVVQGAVVQGCAAGDCGGGAIVEGEIFGEPIHGVVIEGSEIAPPAESGTSVPEPPSQAPTPGDIDKDA